MTLEVTDLSDDIESMAKSLAARWPGVDAEDISQEMLTVLCSRWDALTQRATGFGVPEEELRKLALGIAHKTGLQYCSQEREDYQRNSAQWIYTPSEIRALLPSLWDGLAWEDAPKRPSRGKERLEADGISILMMDMKAAFEAVAEQHQATILSVFRDGSSPSGSTEGMRVTRAVDALTDVLNRHVTLRDSGDHDGPGARRAMSNAAARFNTDNDF